jgi:hypothetical protein
MCGSHVMLRITSQTVDYLRFLPPPPSEERMFRKIFTRLRTRKTKTLTAVEELEAEFEGAHSSPPLPMSRTVTPPQAPSQETCQSNIEIEGTRSSPQLPLSRSVTPSQAPSQEADIEIQVEGRRSSPQLPLSSTVTPSQAPDQEGCQSNIEIEGTCSSPPLPLTKTLAPYQARNREMSQSNIKTQPGQYLDPERERIRAENIREFTCRFRVLIIGRANAGKTTILQRVCHTTEQPKIFNVRGSMVCVIHIHHAIE